MKQSFDIQTTLVLHYRFAEVINQNSPPCLTNSLTVKAKACKGVPRWITSDATTKSTFFFKALCSEGSVQLSYSISKLEEAKHFQYNQQMQNIKIYLSDYQLDVLKQMQSNLQPFASSNLDIL